MRRGLVFAAAPMTALIAAAVLPATANSAVRASAGSTAMVDSVSCGSPGNCAAGGQYFDALGAHAFVLTERNGRWGRAVEVPGLAALNSKYAQVSSVSCAPACACAAGGYYQDALSRYHAFVTREQSGRWGHFTTVFSARTASSAITGVFSLSCPARASCAAGGGRPPFVVSEVNGRWRRAIRLPARDKSVDVFVSCASAGNCAVGWSGSVASERNGHWGKPIALPGLAALGTGAFITSVSCTSAVNCAVGGDYFTAAGAEVFVASERNGRWGKAIEVPGFTALNQEGGGLLASVSCISAGNCAAGGSYAAPAGFQGGAFEAFLANERNGHWGKAFEVPGIPPPSSGICEPDSNSCVAGQVLSVSCAPGGHCAVGGWYDTPAINGQVAFVASYKNGRWGKIMQIPGLESLATPDSQVNSVSCTPAGSCAAGGSDSTTGPAFVVDENNGTWGQAQTVRF